MGLTNRLMTNFDSHSIARRKSNASSAFLDVPGGNCYNNNGDDTVTLRTFSASNKGEQQLCFMSCDVHDVSHF